MFMFLPKEMSPKHVMTRSAETCRSVGLLKTTESLSVGVVHKQCWCALESIYFGSVVVPVVEWPGSKGGRLASLARPHGAGAGHHRSIYTHHHHHHYHHYQPLLSTTRLYGPTTRLTRPSAHNPAVLFIRQNQTCSPAPSLATLSHRSSNVSADDQQHSVFGTAVLR